MLQLIPPPDIRALFVDDEPRVLQGLERVLFGHAPDWDLAFAVGGAQALIELERAPADIVVTDMRMPGMDGAQLLEQVQHRWPATLRVILSGHVDGEAALRTMGVAHQFVAKPCDSKVLLQSLQRMVSLRKLLGNQELRRRVGGLNTLPAAPQIFSALNRAMSDPATGAAEITAIVLRDPAITAKVLQMANSAFFGRASASLSIRDAVTRLGVNNLRQLVLCTELFGSNVRNEQAERLQRDALLASQLVLRLTGNGPDSQAAQMAALLADVGMLLPEVSQLYASEPANSVLVAHAGAYLLGMWQIALPIVEAVAHQHAPAAVAGADFSVVGLVHVAKCLAQHREPDCDYLQRAGVLQLLPEWRASCERLREAGNV